MESDQEDDKSESKSVTSDKQDKENKMSHEDLSDVSDIDSMGPDDVDKELKVSIISVKVFFLIDRNLQQLR